MDFQALLDGIDRDLRPELGREGRVASYIPALARVPAAQFGIALRTCAGEEAARRRQRGAVLDPERLQAVRAHPGDAPARRRALGADPPRAVGQPVQLAAAARERAGHPAQSVHQRRRDRRVRPAAQRPRRRRQGEPARDAFRPRRRGDRLRRRGRGVGGGHRLSQRRPRQLHEELRQDRQRRRRRARLLLPPVRAADELPPAGEGGRLPLPRRRPSRGRRRLARWSANARRAASTP